VQSQVSLVRCDSYRPEDLEPAVDRSLDLLGGLGQFVARGDRVLVKPNFICGRPAGERPAQTHPAFIVVVLKRLLDLGAKPVVSDSPAWGSVHGIARWIGLTPMVRKLGVPIVEMGPSRNVRCKHTQVYRHLSIGRLALEVDKIVNVPKFKSHGQLYMTVAVKNMFGCVMGRRKAFWHVRAGDAKNFFAWMLLEVWQTVTPALTLIDGITAMQGQGPTMGDPYPLGAILGGVDGVALDRVGCELVCGDADKMRTLAAARDLGIGQTEMDGIEVIGESLAERRVSEFNFAEVGPIGFSFQRFIKGSVRQRWLSGIGH